MSQYEKELQELRPHDEVQDTERDSSGYDFIVTASHGYLVVPKSDTFYYIAEYIVEEGYTGKLAIYLEEDYEAGEFIEEVRRIEVTRKED